MHQTYFFCHLGSFFSSFTAWKNENFKKMKKTLEISSFYTSLPKFMIICYTVPEIWRVTDVLLFFILGYIFPIYKWKKMKQPKTWKFQKNEKKGLEISFYANHDHILYCSWDMARETCNCYFSFWAIFCHFTSLPTLPDLEISFYTCVPKIMISWCTVPEIWWATDGRKRWHIEVTFKKAKGVLV